MDTPYASGATGFPGEGGRDSSPATGVETQRLLTDAHRDDADAGSSEPTTSAGAGGVALREELARMKGELDALMARAATLSDHELASARDQLLARFSSVRHAARGVASDAREQWGRGVDFTSDYVRENPWQSVAIAAGAGMLISLLTGRD